MMMKKFLSLLIVVLAIAQISIAQSDRWQQACDYKMEIDVDAEKHQYAGKQKLVLTNNSPDQLNKVFYHLYFNAFQPGSMMDIRSLTIPDPDRRVGDRISKLKPEEEGYIKVNSLTHNGKDVKFEVVGTILEVTLNTPIAPGAKATFDMVFDAQVPLQVRRSGRDSKEGIDYSMSQWYPKMCEYDYQGWHSNPYVGREFHGIWGDFDVKISIDKSYILGGTGYLQNANEIGYGYEAAGTTVKRPAGDKLTWHFNAPNVHDFFWGADPDYTHESLKVDDDLTLHFLYQKNEETEGPWSKLPEVMAQALTYIESHYGEYPYKQYSFVQGGDGGMEYPMGTLITGERGFESLVGVSVHEWMHSWYQMIMGTNEALYGWMDEGFTSYASENVMNWLRAEATLPGEPDAVRFAGTYMGYINLAQSGVEEPLTTHADHFKTNFAYSLASYVKGAVFLHQLEYIIGKKAFDKGMLEYYNQWKFKHPNPNDFIRVMEKESGLELDWYKEHWVNSINTIDYGVTSVEKEGKGTKITLAKVGVMPMPIDIVVTEKDGTERVYHIPLRVMRGEKPAEDDREYEVQEDWPWTNPSYEFVIPCKLKKVVKVEIDPSSRMADVNKKNNAWEGE
jgi:hypothetical protein